MVTDSLLLEACSSHSCLEKGIGKALSCAQEQAVLAEVRRCPWKPGRVCNWLSGGTTYLKQLSDSFQVVYQEKVLLL